MRRPFGSGRADDNENKINLTDTCRKDLCALVDGEASEVEERV